MENLIRSLHPEFPDDLRICELPFQSRGFWRRVANMAWARYHMGNVNHIFGDVHYLAIVLPKRALILTIHDLVHLRASPKIGLYRLLWFFWPLRRCEWVTAISETTRSELITEFPKSGKKAIVVPDCLTMPCVAEKSARAVHETWRILQIGTKPNKNISRLLRALCGLPVELTIIGIIDAMTTKIAANYRITLRNLHRLPEAELRNEYQRCDLTTVLSIEEGFGLVILEAQAHNTPVVCSNISSMPEVAGNGAIYADPYDVDSMRNAIRRACQDSTLRAQVVKAGRANVERFSPRAIAQQYVDLYQIADNLQRPPTHRISI